MGVKLTETPEGDPMSELTGNHAAIARIDSFCHEFQGQKFCETARVLDVLLDLRNDLSKQ